MMVRPLLTKASSEPRARPLNACDSSRGRLGMVDGSTDWLSEENLQVG